MCPIASVASSETGIAGLLPMPCAFVCREIVGSERRRGKQVENKERHFQEVAKGKYARTHVCLTMKTIGLKTFYASLHFK